MRLRAWISIAMLLAWCGGTPADTRVHSTSAYAGCLDAADPAACLARRAVEGRGLRSSDLLDAVLRHGLVDLVPARSADLASGLDSVPPQVLYPAMRTAMHQPERKSLTAAIALLAAARHDASPFDDPIYRELTAAASDDPQIPVLAVAVWAKYLGDNTWPPEFKVKYAGLPAIWARAQQRRQQDAELLSQISFDLGRLDELKPQAREFLVWYAQHPERLTTEQRLGLVTPLARYFGLPKQAAAAISGLDDTAGWSMTEIRSEIGVARLAEGYDAPSARHVVTSIRELFGIAPPRIRDYDAGKRDALERAGAREELRELGAAYVSDAEDRQDHPGDSETYAAASDYYRRAGDRDRALELARRALAYMPALVRRAVPRDAAVNWNDPAAMARAARGEGIDAAVALYRAGAIEEALNTHYLTAEARYHNAEIAGEKKDPLWMLDYGRESDADQMASEVARSHDRELQQRAYDGLVRSCGKPLAACSLQSLRNIAQVAAGRGDRPGMKAALAAALGKIDEKQKDANAWVLVIAGYWAQCEELLTGP